MHRLMTAPSTCTCRWPHIRESLRRRPGIPSSNWPLRRPTWSRRCWPPKSLCRRTARRSWYCSPTAARPTGRALRAAARLEDADLDRTAAGVRRAGNRRRRLLRAGTGGARAAYLVAGRCAVEQRCPGPHSNSPSTAVLLAERTVPLIVGENEVPFDVTLQRSDGEAFVLRAVITAEQDTHRRNNTRSAVRAAGIAGAAAGDRRPDRRKQRRRTPCRPPASNCRRSRPRRRRGGRKATRRTISWCSPKRRRRRSGPSRPRRCSSIYSTGGGLIAMGGPGMFGVDAYQLTGARTVVAGRRRAVNR